MSAGPFEQTFYEGDSGDIHVVRVQPETLATSFAGTLNDAPAGPATSPFWAKVSKGVREYGLSPRTVNFIWDDGQTPAGYKAGDVQKIAVMQTSVFNAITINSAATYLGGTGTIRGKTVENLYPGI